MEVRRIKTPEEKIEFSKIQTVAFAQATDYSLEKTVSDMTGELEEDYKKCWAAFDERGKMCSVMETPSFTVMFDGNRTGMVGIAGVASLPEARNKGYVRALLKEVMTDALTKGQVFSYLFPFSFEYYRKFGYELGRRADIVTVPLSMLGDYRPDGDVVFFQKDDDYSAVAQIYDEFINDKNLAVVRDTEAWKWINEDPYAKQQYTYIYHDAAGKALSYLVFSPKKNKNGGNDMFVREFAWANGDGFRGMLGFAHKLRAQYANFIWDAPDCVNAAILFKDCYAVNQKRECSGMNRILDAIKALAMMKTPEAGGSVVIEIFDKFLDHNNGRYLISWGDGKTTVKLTDIAADMQTDIETLSQMTTGFVTPSEACYTGRVKVNSKKQTLDLLFCKKNLFMTERF